jgi:ubiquinone/menaquinone biosynthesis C-methylase UbiE/uncharacterized protein YbaR (Trm112 family)
MKESLLNLIACPVCHGQLTLHVTQANGEHIEEGSLFCNPCSETYPIHKKMPYLISDTNLEEFKAMEREGWVNIWQKKGMYETADLDLSFQLPYLDGVWKDVGIAFDITLADINLTGKETILDIGAGQGWAGRYFAAKGCTAVSMDIVADEFFGLGRAWAIMEQANVYYEPILADGDRLPFPEATFDIVFFSTALHHFVDFSRILSQVYRVLKPGGRIIGSIEPAISVFWSEKESQAQFEEIEEGIVERRPYPYQYRHFLKQAGFQAVRVDWYEVYQKPDRELRTWLKSLRRSLLGRVRTRYIPVVWLGFTLACWLPRRQAIQLGLNLAGGSVMLRGIK